MKNHFLIFLVFVSINYYANSQSPGIWDHTAISRFDSITSEERIDASSLRLMFRHASVGTTVNSGLECLQGTLPKCAKLNPKYLYDRRSWFFQPRGNSGWYGKVDDFTAQVELQSDTIDIFSFKYCYLDGLDEVAEPCGGTPAKPASIKKAWDYLKSNMELLEAKHPQKRFIWWTIPLTQIGQFCTDTMNYMIRDYCRSHKKLLFDIADIECYDTLGNRITNEKGWEKAFKPYCGEQKEGATNCHPNDLGASLLAKAFWVMMVDISKILHTGVDKYYETNNPIIANGILKLNPDIGSHNGFRINIYDVLGNLLVGINTKESSINLTDLNLVRGLYLVEIKGNTIRRVIKYYHYGSL